MCKKNFIIIFGVVFSLLVHVPPCDGQDSTYGNSFKRIMEAVSNFIPDTSAVPADRKTRLVKKLRELRGGFNINEAIAFKLEEERQKDERPAAETASLARFFQEGPGKEWLNNAMVRIYRDHFTQKELKQLIRFYRSEAGRKMAADLPVIMLKALKTGEFLKDQYLKGNK